MVTSDHQKPKRVRVGAELYNDELEQLPLDILDRIFLTLTVPDIFQCMLVNKHWNIITEDDFFWKRLLKQHMLLKDIPASPTFTSWKDEYKSFYVFQLGRPKTTLHMFDHSVPLSLGPQSTVAPNDHDIYSVVFSTSGRFLATSTVDRVLIWDIEREFLQVGVISDQLGMKLHRGNNVLFNDKDDKLLISGYLGTRKPDPMKYDIIHETGTKLRPLRVAIFSFPSLVRLKAITFGDDQIGVSQSDVKWFGLNSIFVEFTLGSDDESDCRCEIHSTNPENEQKLVVNAEAVGVFAEIANNTSTGQKYIVSCHISWNDRNPSWLISVPVTVKLCHPESLHSCQRCKNAGKKVSNLRPNCCVVADYATPEVSLFNIDTESRKMENLGTILYSLDINTSVDDRLLVLIGFGKDGEMSMCLLEYTLELLLLRTVPLTGWRGSGQLWSISGVKGQVFTPLHIAIGKFVRYDHNYPGVFVEKRFGGKLLHFKELYGLQPVRGEWLVVACKDMVKCYRAK